MSGRQLYVRTLLGLSVLRVSTLCALVLGCFLTSFSTAAIADSRGGLSITVLSSHPDLVSGGDALISVDAHDQRSSTTPRMRGGTAEFTQRADGSWIGLVRGLHVGYNPVTIGVGWLVGTVLLRDFPLSGPVFSGPRQQPFTCETANFVTVSGARLPPTSRADCAVPTRVDLVYRSTKDNALHPLPSPQARPADLEWIDARTPYIVRVETGVIDRSIYELAVLADPAQSSVSFRQPPRRWNGKLVYTFGGGCPGGWYTQGSNTGGVTEDHMLRGGFAVASSSLNVFGNNCDDLLATETMEMTKEHIIEEFGLPDFTMGWGCSGGSYQVHQIGDNYPGLLDGIVAACSFPEVDFATVETLTDARLLQHYFQGTTLSEDQQRAVAGFGDWKTIGNLVDAAQRIDPRVFCPPDLTVGQRYDPVSNPHGVRCDVYDHQVNVYGKDPRTGFVRRPLDNVGIQYGLDALRAGTITVAQFLDMNKKVGGFDQDANFISQRTVGDPHAIATAYRTGRLLNGGAGLRTMPIIDYRDYADDVPTNDIHLRFQSFSTRARLIKANGNADNQVMLVEDPRNGQFNTGFPVARYAFDAMDRWLDNVHATSHHGDARQIMLHAKPSDLTDSCWTRTANPQRIVEPQLPGVNTTTCNTLYPAWPAPREVAGASVANDIVKCRLAAPHRADYPPMTTAQWTELATVFHGGVCQWNQPGIGQQGLAGTWLNFGTGTPSPPIPRR